MADTDSQPIADQWLYSITASLDDIHLKLVRNQQQYQYNVNNNKILLASLFRIQEFTLKSENTQSYKLS